MDTFYSKYIKYKLKYTKLKHIYSEMGMINMSGGGKPSIDILKGIGLFEPDSDIDLHLNPIYGFLWMELGAISNYYNFGNKQMDPTAHLIQNIFHQVPGTLQPTKELLQTITPEDLGKFLGMRYYYKVNLKEQFKNITQLQMKLRKDIKNFNTYDKQKKNSQSPKLKESARELLAKNVIVIEEQIKRLVLEEYASYDIPIDIQSVNVRMEAHDALHGNNTKESIKTDEKMSEIIATVTMVLKLFDLSLENFKNSAIIESHPLIGKHIEHYGKWTLDNDSVELFYTVLAVVWWVSNDKKGIENYYRGVNSVLPASMQVIIPHNFKALHFNKGNYVDSELTISAYGREQIMAAPNFYLTLAKIYKMFKKSIDLQTQEYTTITPCNIDFADCGETSLRDFLQIITYDEGIFNLEILRQLGGNENIITFFKVFNTNSSQASSEQRTIFGQELNARDAWGLVVSNLPNVNYINKCSYNGSLFHYEMNDGSGKIPLGSGYESNMLCMIRDLFTKINDWSVFRKIIPTCDVNVTGLNTSHHGTIIVNAPLGTFVWTLMQHHYDMRERKESKGVINIDDLTVNEKFYTYLMKTSTEETVKNYIPLESHNKKWYYFLDLSNAEDVIMLANKNSENGVNIVDDNYYNSMIFHILDKFDNDKVHRTEFNLNKLQPNTIHKYYERVHNVMYDDSKLKNINNVVEIKIKADIKGNYFLHYFQNLKKLTMANGYASVNTMASAGISKRELDSLGGLRNLQHLQFGDNFDIVLGDSLNTLISLQHIVFGKNFNKRLNNSLNNLVNLESIIFGENYNQFLSDSLSTLTKLEYIKFGNRFNKSLGTSLNSLRNLKQITFGNMFDQNLGTSLYTLQNLKRITFGHDFNQPLGTSLQGLTNLEQILLGNGYNQDSRISFTNLPKLITLNLGKSFSYYAPNMFNGSNNISHLTMGGNTSFGTIINIISRMPSLVHLNLGKTFNRPLGVFPESLVNLRLLEFGDEFNNPLDNALEKLVNLESLVFGKKFNQKLNKALIPLTKLHTLIFGENFNMNIEYEFEYNKGLKVLTLPKNYDHSIKKLMSSTYGTPLPPIPPIVQQSTAFVPDSWEDEDVNEDIENRLAGKNNEDTDNEDDVDLSGIDLNSTIANLHTLTISKKLNQNLISDKNVHIQDVVKTLKIIILK